MLEWKGKWVENHSCNHNVTTHWNQSLMFPLHCSLLNLREGSKKLQKFKSDSYNFLFQYNSWKDILGKFWNFKYFFFLTVRFKGRVFDSNNRIEFYFFGTFPFLWLLKPSWDMRDVTVMRYFWYNPHCAPSRQHISSSYYFAGERY